MAEMGLQEAVTGAGRRLEMTIGGFVPLLI